MNKNPAGILEYLAGGVPRVLTTFNGKTGRFLAPNGGWAVTNQDVIYPLAMLYATPGTRYYRQKKILDLCGRAGDAWREFQEPDGSFEFIKVDGSRWGKIFMPWSIYHWLETFILLHTSLDRRRVARWRQGLTLAYEGLAATTASPSAHNISTWNGMSLTRAGQFFNRPDWLEIGRNQCRFSAREQHPHGFWPEGDGPTTQYNFVYMHALGLYHAFTKDRTLEPVLRRGTDFHTTFVYPDMTSVETVDGRVRYHQHPQTRGWPAFSLAPRGRRLIRQVMRHLPKQGGLDPALASALQHMTTGPETCLLQEEKRGRTVYGGKALLCKHDDWFFCVSGYSAAPANRPRFSRNRWIKTRSNALGLWHRKTGLLVGGGNSKHDSLFATFEVWDNGALRLEPDSLSFSRKQGRETVRFRYGNLSCLMHLKPLDSKRLELVFELPAATRKRATVQACFSLRLKAGTPISWSARAKPMVNRQETVDPLHAMAVNWDPSGKYRQCKLRGDGWVLDMPVESVFEYPVYPFNPYAIDNHAPVEDCVGVISAGFLEGRVRRFVLRIP